MTLDDYIARGERAYADLARTIASILERGIKQAGGPRPQAVQFRAKDSESLRKKLEARNLAASAEIEAEIKDLAGVRLIFYTNTDVDRFLGSRLIAENFDVDWEETRVHHPIEENQNRRYQAIHYIVALSNKRTELSEYAPLAGLRCEIQIQTVLGHAWAEVEHDMVYKARHGGGFGTRAQQALDARMKRIMDDHLRPAGYEFQKVQHDYERLLQGKSLFDRGSLDALRRASDNNERHELLSQIAEYVIPQYDDLEAVFPEICQSIIDVVSAAHKVAITPIDTPFGALPGKSAEDVVALALDVVERFRYVNVSEAFNALVAVFKVEAPNRKPDRILSVAKRLAEYNLNVWEKAGAYVQRTLADAVESLSPDDATVLRPVTTAIWCELLSSDIRGVTTSHDTMIIRSGALPASDEIRGLRQRALQALLALLDRATDDTERRHILAALRQAARLPSQANYSNGLLGMVLKDTADIADALSGRIRTFAYDLAEHVESGVLRDYRRAHDLAIDPADPFGCRDAATRLMQAALALRDQLNADTMYVRYKTLVGFESVFSPDWERGHADYETTRRFRQAEATRFTEAITEDDAEAWYRLIQRCAATKSDDLATFPIFAEFLRQVAKAKPQIVIAFLRRNDADVLNFLPVLLSGLREGAAPADYEAVINVYLDQSAHLTSIARHCRIAGPTASGLAVATTSRAIAAGNDIALFECLAFGIEHHQVPSLPLMDDLVLPAIRYLTGRQDARWIRGVYYRPECSAFFGNLTAAEAELILSNLLALTAIDHPAQTILRFIAQSNLPAVWQFLGRRLMDRPERPGYEAVPHELYQLRDALAADIGLAIETVRSWYHLGDSLFRFTGGRLFQAVYPEPTAEVFARLAALVDGGSDEDSEFAVSVLENYHGEPATHGALKAVVAYFSEDDPRLRRADICLDNTGVVGGEFGFVEAYRAKRAAVEPWLHDARARVRVYAEGYLRRLTQRIASEQRRAEGHSELWRREREDDTD